ncbi:hypothetical protein [Photobacterium rosenbergii]|uniref:hypothetical protein n=1 Tax=Photobacterium rosenbergii TaxID=294936 RepID=UPI001C999809|nr:hypothetical protein [Photobacterium rosenbergii]MBY5944779.1 hypothetical protein [Photobacterium rosenbergii]
MNYKTCSKCGITKPVSEFTALRGAYRPECNECRRPAASDSQQKARLKKRRDSGLLDDEMRCVRCGEAKPRGEFTNPAGNLRRNGVCLFCSSKAELDRLIKNAESRLARNLAAVQKYQAVIDDETQTPKRRGTAKSNLKVSQAKIEAIKLELAELRKSGV